MNAVGERPIRKSFAWNFVGNTLYSLAQWLLLVLLARLSNPHEVGEFALLLAVSAPVFLTTGMNLRIVQATDTARLWGLEDYLLLRHVLNIVATVITMVIALLMQMDVGLLAAMLAIAGAKAVEALSQTYYGFFQQDERHDLVAQSMLMRSVTGPVCFVIGYAVSGILAGACVGLLLGWAFAQQVLDRPRARRIRGSRREQMSRLLPGRWPEIASLARKAAPLGLDQGVTSLGVNVPRYLIQAKLGAASLGVYSTLAYLAQAVSMVTSALGIVVVPRLAKYKHAGLYRAYLRLLFLSTLFSVLVSVAAVGAAALLGEAFIRLLLGEAYVDRELLLVLLVGAAAVTLQRSLGRGLTGAQRFTNFLVIDSVTTVTVAVAALIFVAHLGVVGAAWATVLGNVLGSLACLWAVRRVVNDMRSEGPKDDQLA